MRLVLTRRLPLHHRSGRKSALCPQQAIHWVLRTVQHRQLRMRLGQMGRERERQRMARPPPSPVTKTNVLTAALTLCHWRNQRKRRKRRWGSQTWRLPVKHPHQTAPIPGLQKPKIGPCSLMGCHTIGPATRSASTSWSDVARSPMCAPRPGKTAADCAVSRTWGLQTVPRETRPLPSTAWRWGKKGGTSKSKSRSHRRRLLARMFQISLGNAGFSSGTCRTMRQKQRSWRSSRVVAR
mmetsp:Transcript_17637/g.48445  ORF Transcript_17637/g.48445 Transcript_17637/m.48445 type:complete len:238 (-) Transcript_17637:411-1124(-)